LIKDLEELSKEKETVPPAPVKDETSTKGESKVSSASAYPVKVETPTKSEPPVKNETPIKGESKVSSASALSSKS